MSNFSGQDRAQIQVYLVGGAVRDKLLGLPVVDRDYVVVGATPELMIARGFKPVGLDFPVFLHPQTGEEYALARTERKTGHGYHGFSAMFSPDVSLEQDLSRRDLTINAMAENDDGAIIDPYHGQRDIKQKRLRHVSDAFCEDPLRVLRLLRFHAKLAPLGFHIDQETWQLTKQMVAQGELEHLTVERVWLEVTKALASDKPTVFFKDLYQLDGMNVLGLKTKPPIERFQQMQSMLALVSNNSEVAALRFAAWLEPCAQAAAQIAKIMPLPRIYQYWLELFANHAAALLHWQHQSPLAQWQVFKQSGSLRKAGDIAEFAHALGCEETIIAQINASHHKLQTIEPQTFIKQGLQGKALGEAIKSAQLNQLTD